MPYKSDAQRRFFHSAGAAKAGLSKEEVAKWDAESKGQKDMPEHVAGSKEHKRAHMAKAMKKAHRDYRSMYPGESEPSNPHNSIKM